MNNVFQPLARGDETEGEQYSLSLHTELALVKIRIDERHVRNAVRDKIDVIGWRLVNVLQHPPPALAHHDDARRQTGELLHHAHLLRTWLLQDRVKVGDNREIQPSQQREEMAASRSAINAKFVLHADHFGIGKIQEVRRTPITAQIRLGDLESHLGRIPVTLRRVIHRNDEALRAGALVREGAAKIVGKRRDAAFAWQVIPNEGDLVQNLADHKRLSGGCDFNSLNNSSRGTVAKLVHWSLIA